MIYPEGDLLRDDDANSVALFGADAGLIKTMVRGNKKGGSVSRNEFVMLKAGMRCWLSGEPFGKIELALGAPATELGHCKRARDLALRFVNRHMYMVAVAIAELAKLRLAVLGGLAQRLAVLETLGVALRKGLDTPEKVAFAYLRPGIRSRVLIHLQFASMLGDMRAGSDADYAAVLSRVETTLAFRR